MAYTYYLADCSHAAIEDCYYRGIVNGVFVKNVEAGDTIVLPSGSGTWGAPASNPGNGGRIYFILPITITGQGDDTVITIAEDGSTYNNGVINLWSAITFSNMKIIGANTRPVTPIVVSPYNNTAPGGINFTGAGLRITNITYQGRGGSSYFMYGAKVSSALIDNCRISGGTGNSELIFARGPDNAWQNNNTLGGANNIFIEDCVFAGSGYVSDANSNCRMVVRNCTITGAIKVDGHGLASNGSPARGVRNMEVYNNNWTYSSSFWAAIELRGGTNMVFNNRSAVTNGWFFLTDYGYLAQWPNFGSVYQTPVNYPIKDQIGVSKDPKTAAGEPNYVWGNRVGSSVWPRQTKAVPAAASTLYQSQTGTASFTEYDMIRANRDFFAEAGFDTTQPGGVTIGTAAEMAATTPTTQSVGFWVTDEGSWNQNPTGSQGRLYTWSGSSWNLYYEPYTYPHPLRSASFAEPTPTPTSTITPTVTLTPDTPTPTPTSTITPTATLTPDTPTPTPTVTSTVTPTITETPTNTPTPTPTVTSTVTPTPSVTETVTPTPSVTVTITPTNTVTPTTTIYPKISVNPLYYGSRSFPLWEKSTFSSDGGQGESIGPSDSIVYAGAIVPLTASQVYYSFDYYAIYPPHTIYSAGAFWYTTVRGFTASYDPDTVVRIGATVNLTGSDSGIRAIYR